MNMKTFARMHIVRNRVLMTLMLLPSNQVFLKMDILRRQLLLWHLKEYCNVEAFDLLSSSSSSSRWRMLLGT